MEAPSDTEPHLGNASKRIAQRVFVIVENRLQLLMVEAQEERERLLRAIGMTLMIIAFGLLAGITVTVIVAVAFWDHPMVALVILAASYIAGAALFYAKLVRLQRDWQTLPATIDQLRKDRECLEKQLG